MLASLIAIIALIALGLVMLAVAYALSWVIARATICHRRRDLSQYEIARLGDVHEITVLHGQSNTVAGE